MRRFLVIALLLHLGAGMACAESTLRCGQRLVRVGDAKDRIRTICGEPSDVAFVGIIRRSGLLHDPGPSFGPARIDMPVEVWTYDFGSHRLRRRLRFVGDELVAISTAGYGH